MFGLSKAERVKRDNRIEDVIRATGVELIAAGNGQLKGRCPFHEDKNPSLSVNPSKGLWNCFAGCGSGTVIDWAVKVENISYKEAVERLSGGYKLKTLYAKNYRLPRSAPPVIKPEIAPASTPQETVPDPSNPEVSQDSLLSPEKILTEVCRIYQNNFRKNIKAQEYLKSRGINNSGLWEKYQLGYCDGGALKEFLASDDPLHKPESSEILEQLKSIGILNNAGNEVFYKCIVFPIFNQNKEIVGLYGRSTSDKRHLYLKGEHRGLWNYEAALGFDTLYLTEGIIDALSLVHLGITNVTALYGVNGFTAEHEKIIAGGKEINLVMDNDEAGRQAVKTITEKVTGIIVGANNHLPLDVYSVTLPEDIKDANDFIKSGRTKKDFEGLERILVNAVGANSNPAPIPAPAVETELVKTEGLLKHSEDEAHFMYGKLLYQLRGLRFKGMDSLRVVVTVDSGEGKHTDRLDLYVAKSRRSFANITAARLTLQSARVEDDLLKIIGETEKLQIKVMEKESGYLKDKAYQMTEEEKREAMGFLQDKEILKRIVKDLEICGYVGEEINKKICYLSATSRITDKPLSVIIRSSSAAGKSELMEKTAELMPPEQVEFFSRITPQALYYMEKDRLRHKLVIIDERSGSEDADYSIRDLQSRDKLTLAVVIKDPSTGKSRTVSLEIHGPSTIWESTTQAQINQENASRCFELWLDESVEQTKRIHQAQKEEFDLEGWKRKKEREKIIKTHQNAQRLLRKLAVKIPYKERLTFPPEWMRTRRDHRRFLSLISLIALLHQYQREIKKSEGGEEYIEATEGDYREAYHLLKEILAVTFSSVDKEGQDMQRVLNEMIPQKAKGAGIKDREYVFSRMEVRECTGWSEAKIRRGLDELVEMGYVELITGRRGSRCQYRLVSLTQKEGKAIAGLITPEELRAQIESSSSGDEL